MGGFSLVSKFWSKVTQNTVQCTVYTYLWALVMVSTVMDLLVGPGHGVVKVHDELELFESALSQSANLLRHL